MISGHANLVFCAFPLPSHMSFILGSSEHQWFINFLPWGRKGPLSYGFGTWSQGPFEYLAMEGRALLYEWKSVFWGGFPLSKPLAFLRPWSQDAFIWLPVCVQHCWLLITKRWVRHNSLSLSSSSPVQGGKYFFKKCTRQWWIIIDIYTCKRIAEQGSPKDPQR